MVIFSLGVIFLAVFVFCIFGIVRNRDNYDKTGWYLGIIWSAIVLVTLLIAVPCAYAGNATRVAELRAFSESNIQNYATAVEETKVILSKEEFTARLIDGSLEKTNVGQSVSQRIIEWRDAVNAYNLDVAHKQRMRSLWVYPGFLIMPSEVNDLPQLTIK